jgi:hypothetical protein
MTVSNLQPDAAEFIVHYYEVHGCSMKVCSTFFTHYLNAMKPKPYKADDGGSGRVLLYRVIYC